jgi:hypothetical protein
VVSRHRLPSDPLVLRRLCGLGAPAPERLPSPLDDAKRKKQILAVIESTRPYAPAPLLADLKKLDANARARLAIDLITGRDDLDRRWTGDAPDTHGENGWGAGRRRRARMQDLVFQLLTGAAGSAPLIDEARARLAALEKESGGHEKYQEPRKFLGVVRATLHIRAKERIPKPLVGELAKLGRTDMDESLYLRELVSGPDGETIAKGVDFFILPWILDVSKTAFARILKEEKKNSKEGWTQAMIPRVCLLRMIETMDAKTLGPLFLEIAKRTYGPGGPVSWTPPGAKAPIQILTGDEPFGFKLNEFED